MLPAFRFVYKIFQLVRWLQRWKITDAGSLGIFLSKHAAVLVFHIVQHRAVPAIIAIFLLAGTELVQYAISKIVRSWIEQPFHASFCCTLWFYDLRYVSVQPSLSVVLCFFWFLLTLALVSKTRGIRKTMLDYLNQQHPLSLTNCTKHYCVTHTITTRKAVNVCVCYKIQKVQP